jgi:peptide/nickel transport system permease protein
MSRYLVRRLIQMVPLLIGISMLTFLMLQMTPGGPLAATESPGASGRITAEDLERMRNRYGLNDPIYIQYLNWAKDLFRGDWGVSFNTGRPVFDMIMERVPTTLLLTGIAFIVTVIVAIPVGLVAAVKQYTRLDFISTGIAFIGISVPSFWLSLMLLYVFSFKLGWLPSVGLEDLRSDHQGFRAFVDRVQHLLMPVAVLAMASAASLTRYLRASMLDVLSEDYIRTARAKGLSERVTVGVHAFKNGAITIVTVLALEIPDLFIGAVIVESIFAISGMGRLFVDSANLRDYPVLMGILMMASALVITCNLIADLVYRWLDPRIRLG